MRINEKREKKKKSMQEFELMEKEENEKRYQYNGRGGTRGEVKVCRE